MLSRYTNTLQAYLLGVVLIQLLTSFSRLSAMEMPLELLHDGVSVPKPADYARRIFPSHAMAELADMEVEMPPNVDDDIDFATKGAVASNENDEPEEEYATRGGMPKWMEMHHHQAHQYQQHHPDHVNYHTPTQQKQHNHMKHHHSNRQVHTSTSAPASSPLRRCSIEISRKIPGICQSMGSIGNACVSGDYIDAISEEC